MALVIPAYVELLTAGIRAKGGECYGDGRVTLGANTSGPSAYLSKDGLLALKIQENEDGTAEFSWISAGSRAQLVPVLNTWLQDRMTDRYASDALLTIADLQAQITNLQTQLAAALGGVSGDGNGLAQCHPVTFLVENSTLKLECATANSLIFLTFNQEYSPSTVWWSYQDEFAETGINLEDTMNYPSGTEILAVAIHPSFNPSEPTTLTITEDLVNQVGEILDNLTGETMETIGAKTLDGRVFMWNEATLLVTEVDSMTVVYNGAPNPYLAGINDVLSFNGGFLVVGPLVDGIEGNAYGAQLLGSDLATGAFITR